MSRSKTFSHLMSSGRIGSMELRNRIVMSPMEVGLGQTDGHCGERSQRYYEERAKGGAGMVIIEASAISWPAGAIAPTQPAISDDRFLPGLRALAERIQKHGCKAAIQLQHAGKVASVDIAQGRPLLVPSIPPDGEMDLLEGLTSEEVLELMSTIGSDGASPASSAGSRYRVATKADIQKLVSDFAVAADRAKRAGFDGMEIHAAHGYIISLFLSPHFNRRDDEYGGPIENRVRLLVEVTRAVRAAVGPDYPVWCRLDATEFLVSGGITFEEARQTARIAEQEGMDAISISAYGDSDRGIGVTEGPIVHEPCRFVDFAAGMKKEVLIPVFVAGRIEPETADELIRDRKADFVLMGRKLLADPELPTVLLEKRPGDVRPCIYCYTCISEQYFQRPLKCAVNPATGRESEFDIVPAAKKRHVLVVGGGPAGMETARVAALRGHRVTLCEKSKRLGGTLAFASMTYEPIGDLMKYLDKQVRDLPIEVRLNQETTLAYVHELNPDSVVVATGAKRDAPPIPGVDKPHVLTGDDLRALMTGNDEGKSGKKLSFVDRIALGAAAKLGLTGDAAQVRRMSRLWMPMGKRVVVIGGGLVGVELAEFLSEHGRQVTIIEESGTFGADLSVVRRWRALDTLKNAGVQLLTHSTVKEIADKVVVYQDHDGKQHTLPADTVIIAMGARADASLANALEDAGFEVHVAGDCGSVGYIEGAMLAGATLGRKV